MWSLLYSPHLVSIELPAGLAESTRHAVLGYLAAHPPSQSTPITSLACPAREAEVGGLIRLVAASPALTHLHLTRAATDSLLELLGRACPVLSSLNLAGSRGVTDRGVVLLLGEGAELRPCHASLLQVRLRGTRVRRSGVTRLLQYCTRIQV